MASVVNRSGYFIYKLNVVDVVCGVVKLSYKLIVYVVVLKGAVGLPEIVPLAKVNPLGSGLGLKS